MILFCFYDDIFEQLLPFFLMFYCLWVFLLSRRLRLGPFEHDMGYESSTYFYDPEMLGLLGGRDVEIMAQQLWKLWNNSELLRLS